MSLGEAPASRSQSQEAERDWMESLASCGSTSELFVKFAQGGSSGKTYPEFYQSTPDVHSASYSMSWLRSGMLWRGECLMLNSSVWPSDGSVCSLSEVLQGGVQQRFCLTPRACRGILARSRKRGRSLPPELERALQEVASRSATGQEGQGGVRDG